MGPSLKIFPRTLDSLLYSEGEGKGEAERIPRKQVCSSQFTHQQGSIGERLSKCPLPKFWIKISPSQSVTFPREPLQAIMGFCSCCQGLRQGGKASEPDDLRTNNEDPLFLWVWAAGLLMRKIVFIQIRLGHIVSEQTVGVCPWEMQSVMEAPVTRTLPGRRTEPDLEGLGGPSPAPKAPPSQGQLESAGPGEEAEVNTSLLGKGADADVPAATGRRWGCDLKIEPGQGWGKAHGDWIN